MSLDVEHLIRQYGHLEGRELLAALVAGDLAGRIAVTSSFGAESAVLLDLVAQVDPGLPVIFLDTNELFDETIAYRSQLEAILGLTNVLAVHPSEAELKEADELWREDHDRCCELRKVRPLARAVKGFDALVDGRKRAHGAERENLATLSDGGGVLKVSPLAKWSAEEIEAYFVKRSLPRHPLVAQNYRSIGCWPCTRPVDPGQPLRAGRWAGKGKSECGIHTMSLGLDGAGI
ncbi:Phosphoadenylyl-sulfate reductase thioredoxin / Adenylyl-sulfate reductase thioredoxin [Paramagnetospirillum magnetotacticum MS-1]|uniref:Adenosine 5'-phosphosulfate reductase n=1 Tax=Paramagnetospirillum magnetotacticum MS-1 TaxID=272627 RepID=A0A0C2YUC6_PARME|nr:phosphoadenylyl-sulfate reductase [Paramagnetospirillum magnetotacticum]KIL98310.1 Phosphoadenylyl-sulfate reductase thioredoxin / Adenylyl-sulfate reductase thioredoxin [Paramagnetospirillum magnetotacticum MS-1]